MSRASVAAFLVLAAACGKGDSKPKPKPEPEPKPRSLTIVATNDLHGQLESLPLLSGYLSILRANRTVLLVDAGDMFQGTMESNLNEGEAVIRAYNALGYHAAAVGNHDFDFGPVGKAVEPKQGHDTHGALKARAQQATFPLLSANVIVDATDKRISWDNIPATATVALGGISIGIIGVATEDLRWVVRPSHFEGLRTAPLVETVVREAKALRERGAEIVVVAAHTGGRCRSFDDPMDTSTCSLDAGVFRMAKALPPDLVDVIVAGHKHGGIAHVVNGIAIVEAYSRGRAFSRVDITLTRGKPKRVSVHPPRILCDASKPLLCDPGTYEGKPVAADPAIAKMIGADIQAAHTIGDEPLGVVVESTLERSQVAESALGNLFADLILAARPDADCAVHNGGALRADIPSGPLTYGRLYRAMSFDNHFALLKITAGRLRKDLAAAFATSTDVVSVAGLRVDVTCVGNELTVALTRSNGKPILDDEELSIATSDYLAIGGDGLFSVETLRSCQVEFDDNMMIRDGMASVLRRRGGTLHGDDRSLYDPAAPRVRYSGTPPLSCD